MNIEPENTGASQTVTAVTDETITINGTGYTHSLIVMPDMLPVLWPIHSFDELTLPDLIELEQYKPDIIVLGTGRKTRFLRQEETFLLLEKGILIECMNNRAACGAYNLDRGRRPTCPSRPHYGRDGRDKTVKKGYTVVVAFF